jgi:hypothetical protein
MVLDLAVVACSEMLPVFPTTFSLVPHAAAHEAVTIAGFSLGLHVVPNTTVTVNESPPYARHARMTRLTSSLQLPEPFNASAKLLPRKGLVAGSVRSLPSSGPGVMEGYLEDKPEQGMSGGPVLDVRCGLLGILGRQSPYGKGGVYVRLGEPSVQRWLTETLENATSGSWEVTV